jgi:hypothetical protein
MYTPKLISLVACNVSKLQAPQAWLLSASSHWCMLIIGIFWVASTPAKLVLNGASCRGLQRNPPREAAAERIGSAEETIGLMEATLKRLSASGGWPRQRIHLLGFSQGGTIALHLAASSK